MNNYKVLIPSFEVEKRTGALTVGVWGFVGLISMFTAGIGVFCFHLMLKDGILNITSTFISDYGEIIAPSVMLFFAAVAIAGALIFLSSLMTAYVILPDKIIKGRITDKADCVDAESLKVQAAVTGYMIENISDASKVSGANGIGNLYLVWRRIAFNMKEGNAQQFFFTDLYKRKEYCSPQLIRENKHFCIYRCGNKRLKIRKLYTDMDKDVKNAKGVSILKRTAVRALLVFAVCFALSAADMAVGLAHNDSYNSRIENTCEEVAADLGEFGYVSKKINNKCYFFEKDVAERTSRVQYYFGLDGSAEQIEFEIYFDESSETMEQEIEYLFTSLNDGITEQQMEAFIQDTQSTIQGDYVYNKLATDHNTIILGTSGGYAHIHN